MTLLEELKQLRKRQRPKLQIAQLTEFGEDFYVKFVDEFPASGKLGFLMDDELDTFDDFKSFISSLISHLERTERLVETVKDWRQNARHNGAYDLGAVYDAALKEFEE